MSVGLTPKLIGNVKKTMVPGHATGIDSTPLRLRYNA